MLILGTASMLDLNGTIAFWGKNGLWVQDNLRQHEN
jgi:hypothetical protein